ncbi:hypothetical protein GCM10009784_02060 [Arthrobacter parietis]|uniref:Putative Flp pilus-assembly TadG-like N-terminal domain-containing protein n=1 Tax=Arthrobacter parietis TaxID=271434 RepID=A0ABP5MFJ0_9MICC
MRRMNQKSDERGAVAVIVAILLVALLGFAAIAVDVGMLYAEKAQLRNGADAAALSIAQTCAYNSEDTKCSTSIMSGSLAKQMVDANALDNQSNPSNVTLNKTAGKVSVTAGALEAGTTSNKVSLLFARALGFDDAEVTVTSSAAWGSPIAGETPFPIAFSICQVQGHVGGGLQVLQSHGSNANPDCNYGPSGQTVPGGFGWLAPDPGNCGALIDIAFDEADSNPGNAAPSNCTATLDRWKAAINAGTYPIVVLPVFYKVTGTGSGAVYDLQSFAAYEVHGWYFSGGGNSFHNTATDVGSAACTNDCRGIVGKFVKYVSLADGYTMGAPNVNGTNVVQLTLGAP